MLQRSIDPAARAAEIKHARIVWRLRRCWQSPQALSRRTMRERGAISLLARVDLQHLYPPRDQRAHRVLLPARLIRASSQSVGYTRWRTSRVISALEAPGGGEV